MKYEFQQRIKNFLLNIVFGIGLGGTITCIAYPIIYDLIIEIPWQFLNEASIAFASAALSLGTGAVTVYLVSLAYDWYMKTEIKFIHYFIFGTSLIVAASVYVLMKNPAYSYLYDPYDYGQIRRFVQQLLSEPNALLILALIILTVALFALYQYEVSKLKEQLANIKQSNYSETSFKLLIKEALQKVLNENEIDGQSLNTQLAHIREMLGRENQPTDE